MTSLWIRILCLLSIVAAYGPQHHAFAHGHEQVSEEREICPVNDLHVESASTHTLEPETDCLACKFHTASAFVRVADTWAPLLVISRSVIEYASFDCTHEFGSHSVRGPPFEIG